MPTIAHFMFGNSLVNFAEGGAQTNIVHWLDDMADWAGNGYAAGGGYGFLRDFADRAEPANEWGFAGVDGIYDSAVVAFGDVTIDAVTITPANFIQYQPWDANYPGDARSPLDATLDLVADIRADQPDAQIFVYEGWAEMDTVISAFPPSAAELEAYQALNQGAYHDWFEGYVDAINAADPQADVTLLPIASTLGRILTETPAADIPASELYVDGAPHGTETLYFLAAAVTYPALYGEALPADYPVPDGIHPAVAGNMDAINTIIGEELAAAGIDVEGVDVAPPDPDPDPDPEPDPEPEPDPDPGPDPDPTPEPGPDPGPDPAPVPSPDPDGDGFDPTLVGGDNAAPTPHDDLFQVAPDAGEVSLDVLANDTDPDGDPLSLLILEPGEFGTPEIVGDQVSYTPGPNYLDGDSFLYFVADGQGGITGARVEVTPDDLPVTPDEDGGSGVIGDPTQPPTPPQPPDPGPPPPDSDLAALEAGGAAEGDPAAAASLAVAQVTHPMWQGRGTAPAEGTAPEALIEALFSLRAEPEGGEEQEETAEEADILF